MIPQIKDGNYNLMNILGERAGDEKEREELHRRAKEKAERRDPVIIGNEDNYTLGDDLQPTEWVSQYTVPEFETD